MHNLPYIIKYAKIDASTSGLALPDINNLSDEDKTIQLARFMAQSGQFFLDDANLDNQKRNLSIRTIIDFSISDIRTHGLQWVSKHKAVHGYTPWFKEWEAILTSATDDEIAKIYLSPDEESIRKRISRPTGLLPVTVSPDVKRKGLPI